MCINKVSLCVGSQGFYKKSYTGLYEHGLSAELSNIYLPPVILVCLFFFQRMCLLYFQFLPLQGLDYSELGLKIFGKCYQFYT